MVDSPYQLVKAGFLNHQQYFQDTTQEKIMSKQIDLSFSNNLSLGKHFPLKMSTFQKRLIFFSTLCFSFPVILKSLSGKRGKHFLQKKQPKRSSKILPEMMFGIWYLHLFNLFCGKCLSIQKLLKVALPLFKVQKKQQNPHKENCHKRWRYHTK